MTADAPRSRPTVLITGASAGLGAEFARLFAADRFDVVLVARRAERLAQIKKELEGLHGINVTPLVLDLSRPETPADIYQATRDAGLRIDMLVNNAGFGTHGFFTETDLATELAMIQVNVAAVTHLTKLFLREMIAHGEGRIMNVASTAGFHAGPLQSVYNATKAFVLHLTEAIAAEARGTGVSVTAFCPGPTKTEFQERAGARRKSFMRHLTMDADIAAAIGYRGMLAGKTVVIAGPINRLLVFGARLMPRSFVTRAIRFVQKGNGRD